jgi:hypothetical protein
MLRTAIAQTTVVIPPQKQVYHHEVFWSKIDINDFFKSTGYRWGWGFDFVFRTKNKFDQGSIFDERLREGYRPWVHYQFSPNARFSLSPIGYMYTHEYIGKPADLLRLPYHEWRTTFQFFHHFYTGNTGKFMHTYRYRYEMRWQNNPVTDEYRYLNRFRFRYRLRYLINSNSFYENHLWYTSVSNEIGLNFGESVVMNTFNQNSFYAGVGYRFANSVRVELRYVNRFRTRGSTGFEFDHGEGVMIGIYVDKLSDIKIQRKKDKQMLEQSD